MTTASTLPTSSCLNYLNSLTSDNDAVSKKMHPTSVGAGEENCIKVASKAVKILNDWDPTKRSKKKKWLYPNMLKRLT